MLRLFCWGLGGLVAGLLLYTLVSFLLVRRELGHVRRDLAAVTWERLTYGSSADGTAPLHALLVRPRAAPGPRLLVMMHGYTESAADCFSAAVHWARRGRAVVVPDLRGRTSELRYPVPLLWRRRPLALPGWRTSVRLFVAPLAKDRFTSAGEPDSGGVEVADLLDAAEAARGRVRGLEPRADIVGYSGGGTSALLAAMRAPHRFARVMAFFPMVDLAAQWRRLRRLGTRPLAELERWMGGTPAQAPGRYAARRLMDGLPNLRYARVAVYSDSADRYCPVETMRELGRRSADHDNIQVRISGPGDAARWHHDTADEDSPLHRAPWPESPPVAGAWQGEWVVLGYLITPGVEVWLGDGQEGLARCTITRAGDAVGVSLAGDIESARVRVRDGARWHERRVPRDGRVSVTLDGGEQ